MKKKKKSIKAVISTQVKEDENKSIGSCGLDTQFPQGARIIAQNLPTTLKYVGIISATHELTLDRGGLLDSTLIVLKKR